ncbi:MAG: alpha-D-glucose phosphate-specific phosphoglucomutase [Deltaproteobacteria bacterium]|nr:alpha-D-glucose phosphate-specific phosphoglucomutase [Deltaproteobacteria bacterium]
MAVHALAGKLAPRSLLINVERLVSSYYTKHPEVTDTKHLVSFGTSGHRGSSLKNSFNEDHILAIAQAICCYRKARRITGPIFMGMDTHALSEPAFRTAVEVLAANGIDIMIEESGGYTPTPVISHAILTHNRGRQSGLADGIVITPSHNPPDSGGIKYNPPEGGPADTDITQWIADKANALLRSKNTEVKRIVYESAIKAETTHKYDYVKPYVDDLENIVDVNAIGSAGLKIGADALGGSGAAYWQPIAERYKIDIDVYNNWADPTFSFMTVDRDGVIRMDCSSEYAMASLIKLKDTYDVAFGNDPDFDRHGIVNPRMGLMNPNHYLSVAIWYLFQNRQGWRMDAAVGKTLVSSGMIDRVARYLGKKVCEVPVGFKWFVNGLIDGSFGFGGEESAGASFLRSDGTVWTTDKDGIVMDLLAAEITARTGTHPGELYRHLTELFGDPVYERIDVPASEEQRRLLKGLSPAQIVSGTLAGEKIAAVLSRAPGNDAPIGGLKVVAENGWFAARPSGTENLYKIYAESFNGREHLTLIQEEAQALINRLFEAEGV